jgi:hypothetical protein
VHLLCSWKKLSSLIAILLCQLSDSGTEVRAKKVSSFSVFQDNMLLIESNFVLFDDGLVLLYSVLQIIRMQVPGLCLICAHFSGTFAALWTTY